MPEEAAPAVRLAGVTKRIGRQAIVRDLDFSVEKGEVFGLLGPNGAGKTTTIRLIVGLISPTEGEILIHGRSVKTAYTEAIARVGAVVYGITNTIHLGRRHLPARSMKCS